MDFFLPSRLFMAVCRSSSSCLERAVTQNIQASFIRRFFICNLRCSMIDALSYVARAFDTKGYPDDKNPKNWRTINGAKTHISEEGKIDGGAGGKFTGKQWTSAKHPYKPKVNPQTLPVHPKKPKTTPLKQTNKPQGQPVTVNQNPAPSAQPNPHPVPRRKVSLAQLKSQAKQIKQAYFDCIDKNRDENADERLKNLLIEYNRAQYAAKPADVVAAHNSITDMATALMKRRLGPDVLEDPLLNLGLIKMEPFQDKINTVNSLTSSSEIRNFIAGEDFFYLSVGSMPSDYKAAQICARSILRIMGRYPALKGAFDEFTAKNLNNEKTYAQCYGWEGGKVEVNTQHFNDAAKFHSKYDIDVKLKFHPEGTDEEAVVTHEYGHAINGLLNQKLQDAGFQNLDFADYLYYDVCGLNDKTSPKKIKDNLSEYGTHNSREFMAEAFAEYVHSPRPRPIALAVGREIERVLTGDISKNIDDILKQNPTFGGKRSQYVAYGFRA